MTITSFGVRGQDRFIDVKVSNNLTKADIEITYQFIDEQKVSPHRRIMKRNIKEILGKISVWASV